MVSLLFCRFDDCDFDGCKDIKLEITEDISSPTLKIHIINPLVSIIIPSLNALESLKVAVRSIQEQLFTDYEVIIIDGNSLDGTSEYLKTLNAPFRVLSEVDKNVYDAMNKGIAMAHGEWLYFLGSDDQLFSPNTLKKVFGQPTEPDTELLIGHIKYDCNNQQARHLNKDVDSRKSNWSFRLWLANTVHHQGVFYKRSIFEQYKYNLKYAILADYDLNLQLYRDEKKAKYINEIVALCGAEGISKDYSWSMYQEEIQLKTNQSSIFLQPVFFILVLTKYLLKKGQG